MHTHSFLLLFERSLVLAFCPNLRQRNLFDWKCRSCRQIEIRIDIINQHKVHQICKPVGVVADRIQNKRVEWQIFTILSATVVVQLAMVTTHGTRKVSVDLDMLSKPSIPQVIAPDQTCDYEMVVVNHWEPIEAN